MNITCGHAFNTYIFLLWCQKGDCVDTIVLVHTLYSWVKYWWSIIYFQLHSATIDIVVLSSRTLSPCWGSWMYQVDWWNSWWFFKPIPVLDWTAHQLQWNIRPPTSSLCSRGRIWTSSTIWSWWVYYTYLFSRGSQSDDAPMAADTTSVADSYNPDDPDPECLHQIKQIWGYQSGHLRTQKNQQFDLYLWTQSSPNLHYQTL